MSPHHKYASLLGRGLFALTIVLSSLPAPAPGKSVSDAVDRKTGMHFPKRLGSFERVGGIDYDPGGYPMAKYFAGQLIVLDVYYYQDSPAFLTEYANCKDYVTLYHGEARLLSDKPSNLHSNGRRAVFAVTDQFLGRPGVKLRSELIMFPHRGRYLKVRATYPAAHAERASGEIDFFVRNLKLP